MCGFKDLYLAVCMCIYVCVRVCTTPQCGTLLTLTPSRPAAEQKVLGGVGSLVRGLTLPSNRVPIETRHKTSCRHTTIIKCTCTSSTHHTLFTDNRGSICKTEVPAATCGATLRISRYCYVIAKLAAMQNWQKCAFVYENTDPACLGWKMFEHRENDEH